MSFGRSGKRWALVGLVLLAGSALGLVAASASLHRVFCGATGCNGTPQHAAIAPANAVANRIVTVRFDAKTAPNLDWEFHPLRAAVEVHPGQTATVAYRVVNRGKTGATGMATFHVTPSKAGLYIDKLQCFCFTRQYLAPGESRDLTVTFFVDPDIVNDPNDRNVHTITLSYTMFRANSQDARGQTASLSEGSPTQYR